MTDRSPNGSNFLFNFQVGTNIQSFTNSILDERPLSLKLSDKNSTTEKIVFVIWFPLIAIFWVLMNWFDVRKPGKMNYFIINYILVNVLMGLLAYLFSWWGSVTGNVLGKCFIHPIFSSFRFWYFVLFTLWFSFRVAHLALQYVNKDYVIL